jgi:plastocyanin
LTLSVGLRATRRGSLFLAIGLAVALLAGCADNGDTVPPPAGNDITPPPGAIEVSADNLAFDTELITAPAGEPITIEFVNHDNQPHNIAIYSDSSRGEELFRGEIITGPDARATYEIPALEAGDYYFDCTVHPEMNGTFRVEG